MNALLEQWGKTGATIDQALKQLAERDAAREERLRGLENGVRMELFTLSNGLTAERGIAEEERKYLHRRIDRLGGMLEQLLRDRGLTVPPEIQQ